MLSKDFLWHLTFLPEALWVCESVCICVRPCVSVISTEAEEVVNQA